MPFLRAQLYSSMYLLRPGLVGDRDMPQQPQPLVEGFLGFLYGEFLGIYARPTFWRFY